MYLKYIEETQKDTVKAAVKTLQIFNFVFVYSIFKLRRRHVMSSRAFNNLRALFSSVND